MKKEFKKGLVLTLVCVGMMFCITACGNDDYEDTLNSGLEKYYNGEEMSREEYNAVKGFNDWKDKQGEKTYDNWD